MSDATAVACVPNIGPKGRRKRLILGLVAIDLYILVVAAFIYAGTPRGIPLALLPFFYFGALGVFQAREQTCVALAARDQRDLDAGPEALAPELRDAVKRQARRAAIHSFLLTLLAGVVLLLIP